MNNETLTNLFLSHNYNLLYLISYLCRLYKINLLKHEGDSDGMLFKTLLSFYQKDVNDLSLHITCDSKIERTNILNNLEKYNFQNSTIGKRCVRVENIDSPFSKYYGNVNNNICIVTYNKLQSCSHNKIEHLIENYDKNNVKLQIHKVDISQLLKKFSIYDLISQFINLIEPTFYVFYGQNDLYFIKIKQ